jgi:amidase
MDEFAFRSTTELMQALQSKEIGSEELLDMYADRCERFNPRVNAVIATDFDAARKRARAADCARAEGLSWGPLHGLPITIKDTFEVAGFPCTAGAPEWKDHRPTRNADVVQAVLDAGAIVYGKTNVPLYAFDFQTYNELHGVTSNPWNTALTPGGSSGGAAVALACGLTSLEIGSDLCSSIRSPAHLCGVYGHKPSFNIVSMRGQLPPRPGIYPGEYSLDGDLVVIGPMARSAEDLELAMDIVAQPKEPQRTAWQFNLPAPRKQALRDFKVGLWLDDPASPVDANVGDCLQNLVRQLTKAGVQVEDRHPDIDFTESYDIYTQLIYATTCTVAPEDRFQLAKDHAAKLAPNDRSAQAQAARGTAILHRDWIRLDYRRMLMRQKWADYFREFDVLLCPVIPVTAFPHDHSTAPYGRRLLVNGKSQCYIETNMGWPGLASLSWLPVTAAPLGLAKNGMPVGVQIIGPYLEDRTTMHFAKLLAALTGGYQTPPGYQ